GILTQLQALSGLPALVTAAAQAREVAADTLALFDHAVLEHHADEEKELFPAVLRHAAPGAEQSRMKALVDRLTADHREIEALWKTQKAAVDAAARGKPSKLDANAVHHL